MGDTKFSADDLADNYIRLLDDLSYAKTFYPNSKLVPFLSNLTAKLHTSVYGNKKEKKSRFLDFWRYEVPLAVQACHKELLYSLIIFLASIGVGIFSTIQEGSFVNQILGDGYVNMTLENIENDDPMAVYKSMDEGGMFLGITTNNVRVSFLAYVLGIFGSILTGLLLLYNGVMVGAFITFFYNKGLFWISFSTIFIHGALELSAIVIAGGAGLALGNSLLFPKTYKRTTSLLAGARRSLKVIIGLVPVFIVAGALESFVTRHYLEMGGIVRTLIIVLSFAFIIWYFIIYPIKVKNNVPAETLNTQ